MLPEKTISLQRSNQQKLPKGYSELAVDLQCGNNSKSKIKTIGVPSTIRSTKFIKIKCNKGEMALPPRQLNKR